jgi:flavin-dependent dehydrogenase
MGIEGSPSHGSAKSAAAAAEALVTAIEKRLRRLEDQFGPTDGKPGRRFRILFARLDGKQENTTCTRKLCLDGTVLEMVNLGHAEPSGEERERLIASFPIEAS